MEVEGGEGKILVLKKVRKFPKKFPEVSAKLTSNFQNEETFYHYPAGRQRLKKAAKSHDSPVDR